MSDPLGLSIGTTNLVAARVGVPPVTRRAVLTLYPHRAPEVGLPSENPNLNEPGLVLRGFVERVGDPVPLVAPDGSSHSADRLLLEALAAMALAAGVDAPTNDLVVAVPAYWSPAAVRALDAALRSDRRLAPNGVTPRLVSDANTALTALQANPGLTAHGVVALLDFGASGTSVTLADAGKGFTPLGETLRYADFSGDQIDQALLTTVLAGIANRGDADPSATAAVGSLARLRDECRRAKERLSADTVTTVAVDLPGFQSEVRVTRAELETAIAPQFDGVLAALEEQLDRHRLVWSNIAAVATIGGGASIPYVTQRLSERAQVPVVTTPRPDLDAVVGAALIAARGPDADAPTGIATAVGDAATAGFLGAGAAAAADDAPGSATFRALAWSQDDDAVADPLPYTGPDYTGPNYSGPNPYAIDETGARPQIQYTPAVGEVDAPARPWYRLPQLAIGAAALVGLVALGGVAYTLTTQSTPSGETTTPTPVEMPVLSTTVEPPPPPPPAPEEPPVVTVTQEPAPPPPVTTTVAPPPTTTTTTEPTTTTTPPTTTTTRTPPPITTTHLNIPGLPPIPIPVPGQPQQP